MTREFLLITMLTTLIACGQDKADPFRNGVPRAKDVELTIPGATGQALNGQRQDPLEGEQAGFYLITRQVTRGVNAGTAAILGLVRGIARHPPTSLSANTAMWGPHTEPLSPNTYRFTVTKNADRDYSYVLEGKGKNESDSQYRVVLSGSHLQAADAQGSPMEDYGNGTFLLDWDAAQKLPEHGREVGTAHFTYSRLSPQAQVTIAVAFRQVRDEESGQLIDADYAYLATPGSGGTFDFKMIKNLDADATKTAKETATIRSRWLETGAGRSDVKASGGDLGSTVATASECWDESFASRYLNLSFYSLGSYGQESVCAFPMAEFSTLSP